MPRYEAVRLFVERTTAVKLTFALTERNAPSVVRVLPVGRHPLETIELAAGSLWYRLQRPSRVWTVSQIARILI